MGEASATVRNPPLKPTALPSQAELRARRARRRRLAKEQAKQPEVVDPFAGLRLPDAETLEAASQPQEDR